jgi:hypothetical protein
MTRLHADSYSNWKAPAQDRELLIWPEPSQLRQIPIQNNAALAASAVRIANVPLGELRQAARQSLGHPDAQQPLIAGGHQSELYHPGVWVKDVLASALAAQTNGRAFHFAVDTDQPKHLNLRWPGQAVPISDDPALTSAAWSGLIAPPSPDHLRNIGSALGGLRQQWNFDPMLTPALALLLAGRDATESSLSARLTAAQRSIDHRLGLTHEVAMVGTLCGQAPYLAFAHHVLANADRFAADYNHSLASYRAEAGITSATRPMPDLTADAQQVEAPFWLDNLAAGSRQRAAVTRSLSGWSLHNGDDALALDPSADGWTAAVKLGQWLADHQLRLSPRALTLTTFLRLVVVDLFIHGIGGGRYDQVTDRLIDRHFGTEPPRFAVTTATMLFPAAVGRSRVCVGCLAHEGHTLRHGLLGEKKPGIVQQIAALPRRSLQRSIAFHNLHGCLSAAAVSSTSLKQWQARYREAEQQDRQDQVLFDRELFYALQPQERLAGMIDRYAATLG